MAIGAFFKRLGGSVMSGLGRLGKTIGSLGSKAYSGVSNFVHDNISPMLRNVGQTASNWVGKQNFKDHFNKIGKTVDDYMPPALQRMIVGEDSKGVGDVYSKKMNKILNHVTGKISAIGHGAADTIERHLPQENHSMKAYNQIRSNPNVAAVAHKNMSGMNHSSMGTSLGQETADQLMTDN